MSGFALQEKQAENSHANGSTHTKQRNNISDNSNASKIGIQMF